MVRVEMDVQYRVVDPEQYLFSVTNADESLSQATDSALRYVVGHTRMDDVLTTGREKVRQRPAGDRQHHRALSHGSADRRRQLPAGTSAGRGERRL